ncbi:MAG: type II toxin-antitoxin system RelB/DinJ family antitoxin [Eubacterium sp.]
MANKTANVNARVEAAVKKEAEGILADMGIPVSVGINMFYRQIIYCHGLPFRPVVPNGTIRSLNDMTKTEFNLCMAKGIEDAIEGREMSVDEAFNRLVGKAHQNEVNNG